MGWSGSFRNCFASHEVFPHRASGLRFLLVIVTFITVKLLAPTLTVLCKNLASDLFCRLVLRREKQIVQYRAFGFLPSRRMVACLYPLPYLSLTISARPRNQLECTFSKVKGSDFTTFATRSATGL